MSLLSTLNDPIDGCPDNKSVNVNVSRPNSAGVAHGVQFCVGESGAVLDLFDFLEGESPEVLGL